MKTQNKLLKISSIKLEDKLYPRTHVDYITKCRYYNAMKAGAQFPPIIVAETGGVLKKYILVDGAHRLASMKDCKKTHAQCEVLVGLDEKQIFIEAIKRNASHGRQFSTQEVTQIVVTLKDWKMSDVQITELVRIPTDKLTSFIAKRMTHITATNEDSALKAPLKNLAGINQENGLEPEQRSFTGTSQIQLLDAIIALFKNDWINMKSAIVELKVKKLYKLMSPYFEKK